MLNDIDSVVQNAHDAYLIYRKSSLLDRKKLLYTIAEEIENLGDALIETASKETNLPHVRFVGERLRTCNQLRFYADVMTDGSILEATIDHAQSETTPAKPDMRKIQMPLGVILVFGASNFPLAYSTAGGDTASALAAGNSIIVKGHPSHPETSRMVASAISTALAKTNMHPNIFQHIEGASLEIGKMLTQHPLISGVGFTGSFNGGKAIYDYAQNREKPIPVFAEMGSTNPVILMREALQHHSPEYAKIFAQSLTMGVGQFCTNPGIMIGLKSSGLNHFISLLALELSMLSSHKMLNDQIHKQFITSIEYALRDPKVETIYKSNKLEDKHAGPVLARVEASHFLGHPSLHEEVFGPFGLVIVCQNIKQMIEVWSVLTGQLTTTIIATENDLISHPEITDHATLIAGRVVFNSAPTGVEVNNAIVHGGPFPSTTDSRFTSVGRDAIKRWLRPVCFQNCPAYALPDGLKDENPYNIPRRINGVLQ